MNATNKSMTARLLSWLGVAALAAGLSGAAMAATGITNTKHNLTNGGPGTNKTAGTDQICVFCHTPHGSNTGAAVPLWNKAFPGTSYTTYDTLNTSSLDGEVLAVGSVSLACLSCHDGTQAMDNMLNTPGSGTIAGAGTAGTGSAGYTLSGANKIPDASIAKLGGDLTNDHPIGIQYCGGGLTGATTTVSGTCADPDFIAGSSTTTSDGRTAELKTKVVNTNQVFWVDVDGTAGRGKGDIQLYTRNFTGANNTPSVECGSCHDPHVDAGTNGISFMRVTTAGSKICLSCHIK